MTTQPRYSPNASAYITLKGGKTRTLAVSTPERNAQLPDVPTVAARMLHGWVSSVGLDPAGYGTHSMQRTKASLIYCRTKNLRAVQRLPGHSKLESTVRYLGTEVDDAFELAEQIDV